MTSPLVTAFQAGLQRHVMAAVIAGAVFLGLLVPPTVCAGVITNDVFQLDTSGNPIYAQGGGVFKFGDTYYWYGVKYNGAVTYYNNPSAGRNSDTSFNAFTCYSSTNLVDWTFENNVMTVSSPGLGDSSWVGRMGVAYNTNTQKYVLVSQFDGLAGSGILFATCDTPTGEFVFDSIQTDIPIVYSDTGDQTIFLDGDGTAYLICSSANGRAHLYVLPLNPDDYLRAEPGANIYNGSGREGNMMFKHDGSYYFCSSDLHGWNASHCYVLESTDILGAYAPEYVMNRSDLDFCHVTQTGFAVTVPGTNGTTVLFVGDRWCDFAGNGIGYNQWCPVSFNGSTPTFESVSILDFDAAAGTWSVAPGNNYILNPSYEADRVLLTSVAGWTSTGSGYGNASGSYNPGRFRFAHWDSSAYTTTTHQLVTGLPDGVYTLSVWYKSTGGQTAARIFARDFGGSELTTNVNTAEPSWTEVSIPNIIVLNGQCDVGLNSEADANQWVTVDDWSLTYTAPLTSLPAPDAPSPLTAKPGYGQISLEWGASVGAATYTLQRSTTNGGPYTTVITTTDISYLDAGLVGETTYYYVAYAEGPGGSSPLSAQAEAAPSAIPATKIVATATLPGTSVTNTSSPILVTSPRFNMSGGNAVALLLTFEGYDSTNTISATFADQSMTLGTSTNQGTQWSGVFYLIDPAVTNGQFVITSSSSGVFADCAYSGIALANVDAVADTDAVANTDPSGTCSLHYTTHTPDGFVLGSCINNAWGSFLPPSHVSGNADQTLLAPMITDNNNGNLHSYGEVPVPGSHTDTYGNLLERNAYVTLAFDASTNNVVTQPVINTITLSTGGLIFGGSGGVAHASYYLLGTTNVALPMADWMHLLTNEFDSSGNFFFTNSINPDWPKSYYRLRLP